MFYLSRQFFAFSGEFFTHFCFLFIKLSYKIIKSRKTIFSVNLSFFPLLSFLIFISRSFSYDNQNLNKWKTFSLFCFSFFVRLFFFSLVLCLLFTLLLILCCLLSFFSILQELKNLFRCLSSSHSYLVCLLIFFIFPKLKHVLPFCLSYSLLYSVIVTW